MLRTDYVLISLVRKIIAANLCVFLCFFPRQDPAGIFELVELVGNGTYGQVYKVSALSRVNLIPCKSAGFV